MRTEEGLGMTGGMRHGDGDGDGEKQERTGDWVGDGEEGREVMGWGM